MGTYKEYKCKRCGYTVEANPKGHDLIMAGEVYSYLCKECREIVDVLTFPQGEKAEKINVLSLSADSAGCIQTLPIFWILFQSAV